jgi:hypothetical protein
VSWELVSLDEARDVESDPSSWEMRSGQAFAWELHAAALKRARVAVGDSVPLIGADRIGRDLVDLVYDHLKRERPEMMSTVRRRLAERAARVGFRRIALGERFDQIVAVGEGSLRTVKGSGHLLLDAYMAAYRRGVLPPAITPVALSERGRR